MTLANFALITNAWLRLLIKEFHILSIYKLSFIIKFFEKNSRIDKKCFEMNEKGEIGFF